MANDCLSRLNNICRNLVASLPTLPHYPMTWSAGGANPPVRLEQHVVASDIDE